MQGNGQPHSTPPASAAGKRQRIGESESAILSALDIASEYAALGVDVVADDPSADGWLPCRAFGRDDANPSAAINVTTGRYKDHGGDGCNLSLWEFAASKAGRFTDWKAARQHFADKAGVTLPKRGTNGSGPRDPAKHLAFLPYSKPLIELWCAVHKPGVTESAVHACGGQLARYRDQFTVIALPVYATPADAKPTGQADQPHGNPCGWVLYNVSGGPLPVFHSKDQPPTWEKMKTTAGSESGLMGRWGLCLLANAAAKLSPPAHTPTEAWKVEGPSDMLAAISSLTRDQFKSIAIICNSGGANEHPKPAMIDAFAGIPTRVIHDADTPGQLGTAKWIEPLSRVCPDVRNVQLPYPVAPKHGRDLRDHLLEGHTWADVAALAAATDPTGAIAIKPKEGERDPHRLAALFIDRYARDRETGLPTIRFWRDEWHEWSNQSWHPATLTELRGRITESIKQEFDRLSIEAQATPAADGKVPDAHAVTRATVSDVLQAACGRCLLPSIADAPFWIDGDTPPPKQWKGDSMKDEDYELQFAICKPEDRTSVKPREFTLWPADEVFVTSSGLLHLPSFIADVSPHLVPATPRLFSPNAVDYPFIEDPPEPVAWFDFLRSLWPHDQESIDVLQEWFGYSLLPDTRHHKILMIVGPIRSGKGTIARVLTKLVGERNVAGPKLSSLENQFGLWQLIGKTLAIVSDARISGRADTAQIVENLLSISGDDFQTIDRKHLPPISMRLKSRFVILSNELPDLKDASGALPSRLLALQTHESFYGRENKELEEQLYAEMPSILRWSIEGWERLRTNGRFTEPRSTTDMVDSLHRLASPVRAFVEDCCLTGDHRTATTKELFDAYRCWCKDAGIEKPGTKGSFLKKLTAAFPRLRSERGRESGEVHTRYNGIAVKGGLF